MFIYMTTGTRDFLDKIRNQHASKDILLLHGSGGSLLMYETDEKKSVFQAPRRYEVISASGQLSQNGYYVCNNIPVSDEGKPVFEHRFASRAKMIENQPGFTAFRLLRPLDSDTYVVMTEWEDAMSFDKWKHSTAFTEAHDPKSADGFTDNTTRIFAGAPYITTYTAKEEDESL